MIEKTIQTETVFEGRSVTLKVHTVEGPKGTTTREVIDHSPAVTIMAVENNTMHLIHQFRKATEQVLIEAPAGCMEPNELPEVAAQRELQEETGLIADSITKLGEMYMAPGFCNEYMHFFLATGLTKGPTQLDHDESIECHQYPLANIEKMIQNKSIIDAKTVVGYFLVKQHLRLNQDDASA